MFQSSVVRAFVSVNHSRPAGESSVGTTGSSADHRRQETSVRLESLGMKFPKPAVNIDEIKQKYHEIVEEAGNGEETEARLGGENGKKKRKKKKAQNS